LQRQGSLQRSGSGVSSNPTGIKVTINLQRLASRAGNGGGGRNGSSQPQQQAAPGSAGGGDGRRTPPGAVAATNKPAPRSAHGVGGGTAAAQMTPGRGTGNADTSMDVVTAADDMA